MNKTELLRETLNKYGFEKEPFLFVISYDLTKFYIEKLDKISTNIKYEINSKPKKINKDVVFKKYPFSFFEYEDKFFKLQEEIKKGNSYLLNLTAKTKIETNLSLDEIYTFSNAIFKLRVHTKDDNFVCFSPEKFVEIVGKQIFTYPMKGTINADIKDAQKILLEDEKELAEHTMVVDLLRNDLGKIGTNVKVEEFRKFSKVKTNRQELYQTSSKISAFLKDGWHKNLGDIFLALLPAGSITGTPKKSTIKILKEIEAYDRDFYTGICGIFDGKNLQSFVLIRFIEKINEELFYKSGGGITILSEVRKEYEELINKVYLAF